jgi:hypothetical protein
VQPRRRQHAVKGKLLVCLLAPIIHRRCLGRPEISLKILFCMFDAPAPTESTAAVRGGLGLWW